MADTSVTGGTAGILENLAPFLRDSLRALPPELLSGVEEIRLRVGSPLLLRSARGEFFISSDGLPTREVGKAFIVSSDELSQSLMIISKSSFYALEEELKRGYITLPGGHRAGICGRAVLENGAVKGLKSISSINFRVARYVRGAARELLPHLFRSKGTSTPTHTLIVSPPCCGKTTVLRDLSFSLSEGLGLSRAYQVAVIDERSEIAAMLDGYPQLPVGIRTDVLDACPKAEGIMLMIRSMSPEVVICDEIGRREDALAIHEAINAGIKVIATAHGGSYEEIAGRPVIGELVSQGLFETVALYSRRRGPGTLERVLNGKGVVIG